MEEIIKKIKSTGYWHVNIRPTKFEKERIPSLTQCRELMESCFVRIYEWAYPFVYPPDIIYGEDWIESQIDSDWRVEYWRFYQSGQFIHYFACYEDYLKEEGDKFAQFEIAIKQNVKASGYLNIPQTLSRITGIFEFAARLAQKGVLQPNFQMSIKLNGMKERLLLWWDGRISFLPPPICQVEQIPFEREFYAPEIMAESQQKALDATMWIFERFKYNPPRQVLAEEQQRFLEKRI